MRLIRSMVVFAVIVGGIGLSLNARSGDGPTSAFLATSYAAVTGNAEALFGNMMALTSGGTSQAPRAPRANVQSVESEGAFTSAMKTVAGWFGGEREAMPRVRPAPGG
ncbi:MAG: hypothetical protein AAGB05_01025 [Pseudomonadota bacterium]